MHRETAGTELIANARDLSHDGRVIVGTTVPSAAAYWVDGNFYSLGTPSTSLHGVTLLADGNYLAVGRQRVTINEEDRVEGLIVRIEPNGNHITRRR